MYATKVCSLGNFEKELWNLISPRFSKYGLQRLFKTLMLILYFSIVLEWNSEKHLTVIDSNVNKIDIYNL